MSRRIPLLATLVLLVPAIALAVLSAYLLTELSSTNDVLASTESTLESTEGSLRVQEDANAALQNENQGLTDANAALLADKTATEEANAFLAANVEEALSAVDDWKSAHADKESDLAEANAELASTTVKLSQTETTLASTENTLTATRRSLDTETQRRTTIARELGTLERLVGSKEQLETEIASLESSVSSSRAEIAEAREELASLEREIARLQSQVAIIPKPYTDEVACTPSMEPVMSCLDRVTFREVTVDLELQVGNVVTFESNDCYFNASECLVVHRIIAVAKSDEETYYLTKGDNTLRDDNIWFPRSDLVDAVVGIEKGAYNDDETLVELRSTIIDIYDRYKDALSPCNNVLFSGGSCVISDLARIRIERLDDDIEYALCRASGRRFCVPPRIELPDFSARWKYTIPPSIFCSSPEGTRVVQTWKTYRC